MEWISIENKLPDYDVYVLWCMSDGYMFIDEIDHDNEWEYFRQMHEGIIQDEFQYSSEITHWMPLPEPPKE